MGVEQQQGTVHQLSLLEWRKETVRPDVPGAAKAMSLAWFREQGLVTLTERYSRLNQ